MTPNISHTLNCRGKILDLSQPVVMGILNLTPDSFFDGGVHNTAAKAVEQVRTMLDQGATIIDIGGYSSRPYAEDISADEEISRIYPITRSLLSQFPGITISVDTFRSQVAQEMLDLGVHMINDISGGTLDPNILPLVARYGAPYIAMHMLGRPGTMQNNPIYEDVVEEVWGYFLDRIQEARAQGIKDLIIDPGFGFGKQLLHNYQLIGQLDRFLLLDLPIMVGVSRKSMIYKLLNTHPADVLPETSIVHFKLLEKGVHILRVHDVQAATHTIRLHSYMSEHGII